MPSRLSLGLLLVYFCHMAVAEEHSVLEKLKSTPNDSVTQLLALKTALLDELALNTDFTANYDGYVEAGLVFYAKNMLGHASDFFESAMHLAARHDDYERYAQMLSNLGVMKEMQGDYVVALSKYQQSLGAFIQAGNIRAQSLVYNNIAVVHQELGNDDLVYPHLFTSYKLKMGLQDTAMVASALNNLGVYFKKTIRNMDSAYHYYTEAVQLYRILGDERNAAICLNNKSLVLKNKGEYESARAGFDQSIEAFRAMDDEVWLGRSLNYKGLLELASGNPMKAVELLREAHDLILKSPFTRILMEIEEALAQAYLQAGLYEQSALMYKQHLALKDSLLNIDKQNEISNLEIQFQTAQKELEIQTLRHDREMQKQQMTRIAFLLVLVFLVLIFTMVLMFMKGRQRKLLLQHKNMQIKQQILQSQMNPHFLFNVLTSVQAYIKNADIEHASQYLSTFSGLIRRVLHSSARESIGLDEEIALLKDYIELEQKRLENGFAFTLKKDSIPDSEEISIPPMMVQPVVENAVKHAMGKEGDGLLEINIGETILDGESYILFRVSDNGPGMGQAVKKTENKHHSMALGILHERKQILRQKLKKKVDIRYLPVEKGTVVEVMLPVI